MTYQTAKDAYIKYKNTSVKNKELECEIINAALNDPEDEALIQWSIAFEAVPNIQASLILKQEELDCIDTVNDIRNSPTRTHASLVRVAAINAYSQQKNWIRTCFSLGLEHRESELMNIWFEQMKEYPSFKDEYQRIKLKFEHKLSNSDENNNLRTVNFYKFHIPLQGFVDGMPDNTSLVSNKILSDLVRQPVSLSPFVHPSFRYENFYIEQNKLFVRFESTKLLSEEELELTRVSLNEQLAEGWGENLQNRPYLHGTQEFSYTFGESEFVEPVKKYSPSEISTL